MANFFYNRAARRIAEGLIDLSADTIKIMLVTSSYVANRDHDFVDQGGANDPIDHELSGTGYVGGLGGAGRKTIAGKVFSEDDANDRGEMDCTDPLWSGINAGTPQAGLVIKEGGADTSDRKSVV